MKAAGSTVMLVIIYETKRCHNLDAHIHLHNKKQNKLRGFSSQANYTYRATVVGKISANI
jgi:hypothetical protein